MVCPSNSFRPYFLRSSLDRRLIRLTLHSEVLKLVVGLIGLIGFEFSLANRTRDWVTHIRSLNLKLIEYGALSNI